MPDLEKIIKGLKSHKNRYCDESEELCPYWSQEDCVDGLVSDALVLLEEQDKIKGQFIEAFDTIRDAYNTPVNREKILLNYLLRNACCCADWERRE